MCVTGRRNVTGGCIENIVGRWFLKTQAQQAHVSRPGQGKRSKRLFSLLFSILRKVYLPGTSLSSWGECLAVQPQQHPTPTLRTLLTPLGAACNPTWERRTITSSFGTLPPVGFWRVFFLFKLPSSCQGLETLCLDSSCYWCRRMTMRAPRRGRV